MKHATRFDLFSSVICEKFRILKLNPKPNLMKQFFSLVAAAAISFGAFAQLPDGSTAPDFTATDINGVEHNLQSYLDQGMTVILDFSATWCGPCWNYHNTHIMRDLYDTFGPDGTGDLMVFHMEADDTTTQADLEGTGTATATGTRTATRSSPPTAAPRRRAATPPRRESGGANRKIQSRASPGRWA